MPDKRAKQSVPQDPTPGVCCSCGYNGYEETPCPKRDDECHCVHWWDGDGTEEEALDA